MGSHPRIGAIKAIRMIGEIDPAESAHNIYYNSWFSEKTENEVKVEALKYFADVGSNEHLEIIDSEIKKNNSSTSTSAIEAYLSILQKHSAIDAAKFAIYQSFETISKHVLQNVLNSLSLLDSDILVDGLSHKNADLRAACLKICAKRKSLGKLKIEEFLDDNDATVRYEALSALDENGDFVDLTRAKSIICKTNRRPVMLFAFGSNTSKENDRIFERFSYEHFSRTKTNSLIEQLSTILYDREYIRIELAMRGHKKFLEDLRSDFDDGFLSDQKSLTDKISIEYPNELKLINDTRDLEAFSAKRFLKRAALGLARLLNKSDITRLRKFIDQNDDDLDHDFVLYLTKYGEWEDLNRIFTIWTKAKSSNTILGFSEWQASLRKVIVESVVKISKGYEGDLLDQGIPPDLIESILLALSRPALQRVGIRRLEAFLDHEHADIRRGASLAICYLSSKSEIAELMDRYTAPQRTRYYNVIHWLDAALSLNKKELTKLLKFVKFNWL